MALSVVVKELAVVVLGMGPVVILIGGLGLARRVVVSGTGVSVIGGSVVLGRLVVVVGLNRSNKFGMIKFLAVSGGTIAMWMEPAGGMVASIVTGALSVVVMSVVVGAGVVVVTVFILGIVIGAAVVDVCPPTTSGSVTAGTVTLGTVTLGRVIAETVTRGRVTAGTVTVGMVTVTGLTVTPMATWRGSRSEHWLKTELTTEAKIKSDHILELNDARAELDST
ncbi:hypothetical protein HDE_09615 [Halotydeus destructor]|nr:hypothetical protein HDE_09615 [Halotydeus destructor]